MTVEEAAATRLPPAYRETEGDCSGAAVFHLQGELAAATAAELRRGLGGAMGETAVLLDLSGVTFVDQVGLGVIMGVIRRIRELGGRVAISSAEPRRGIARALRLAGADRLVWLADSPAGAMDWLSRRTEEANAPDPFGLGPDGLSRHADQPS